MESIFAAKAGENIRAAELLFESEMYNASVNRAYYAALQAAVDALERIGVRFEKIDHATVQGKFSAEMIRQRKMYSGRFGSYLMDLQTTRNIADYGSYGVSKKKARSHLKQANDYVKAVLKEV